MKTSAHLGKFARGAVDIGNLRWIPNRYHVRAHPHQGSIFLMEVNMNILSSPSLHPAEPGNVCESRPERPRYMLKSGIDASQVATE